MPSVTLERYPERPPQTAADVTCTQGTQVSPVREGEVVVKDSLG